MIFLSFSIFFTAAIFWIFKWHSNHGSNLNICIVTNYFVAGLLGFIVNNSDINTLAINTIQNGWPVFAMGALFIATFIFMGLSTRESGVGLTVMASKLSVLITVFLSFIVFKEQLGWRTTVAFPLAICSIILYQSKAVKSSKKWQFTLPLLVLIGSGLVDFCLAYLSKHSAWSEGLNASLIFSFAAIFGTIYTAFSNFRIKRIDLLVGIVLGTINYGSIHFFLLAFAQTNNNTLYFLIFSIGTLLLSSIGSIIIFKEKLNSKKIAALALASIALLLAY